MAPRTSIAPGYMTQLAQIRSQQKMQEEQIRSQEKMSREKMWMDMGRTVVGGAIGLIPHFTPKAPDRDLASTRGLTTDKESFQPPDEKGTKMLGYAMIDRSIRNEATLTPEELKAHNIQPWTNAGQETIKRRAIFDQRFKRDPYEAARFIVDRLDPSAVNEDGQLDLTRGQLSSKLFIPRSEAHKKKYQRSMLEVTKLTQNIATKRQTSSTGLQGGADKLSREARAERRNWDSTNIGPQHLSGMATDAKTRVAGVRDDVEKLVGPFDPKNPDKHFDMVAKLTGRSMSAVHKVYWEYGGDLYNYRRAITPTERRDAYKLFSRAMQLKRASRFTIPDKKEPIVPIIATYKVRGRTIKLHEKNFYEWFPGAGASTTQKNIGLVRASFKESNLPDWAADKLIGTFEAYAANNIYISEIQTLFGLKDGPKNRMAIDRQGQKDLIEGILGGMDEYKGLTTAQKKTLVGGVPRALTAAIAKVDRHKSQTGSSASVKEVTASFNQVQKTYKANFSKEKKKEALAAKISHAVDNDKPSIVLGKGRKAVTLKLQSKSGKQFFKLDPAEIKALVDRHYNHPEIEEEMRMDAKWTMWKKDDDGGFIGPLVQFLQVQVGQKASKEDVKKVLNAGGFFAGENPVLDSGEFDKLWRFVTPVGGDGAMLDPADREKLLQGKAKQIAEVLNSGLNPLQKRRMISSITDGMKG